MNSGHLIGSRGTVAPPVATAVPGEAHEEIFQSVSQFTLCFPNDLSRGQKKEMPDSQRKNIGSQNGNSGFNPKLDEKSTTVVLSNRGDFRSQVFRHQ
jgi:hypothetical protein